MTGCAALLCDAGDTLIAIPVTIAGSIGECTLLPTGHTFQPWLAGFASDPDTGLIPVIEPVECQQKSYDLPIVVQLTGDAAGWAVRVSGVRGVTEVADAEDAEHTPACPRSWVRPVRTVDNQRIWSLRPEAFAPAPVPLGDGS